MPTKTIACPSPKGTNKAGLFLQMHIPANSKVVMARDSQLPDDYSQLLEGGRWDTQSFNSMMDWLKTVLGDDDFDKLQELMRLAKEEPSAAAAPMPPAKDDLKAVPGVSKIKPGPTTANDSRSHAGTFARFPNAGRVKRLDY